MNRRVTRFVVAFVCVASFSLAADVNGIWTGQQQGRAGQPEDVAFQFAWKGQALTGKMFGDEFDLPISDAFLSGDQIRFAVTSTNYYSGSKITFVYTGTIRDGEMELVRERVQSKDDRPTNRPVPKQTIKLKRVP